MLRFFVAACVAAWSPALAAAPKFKHVVIVVQENRTPDNLFGSNPYFESGVDLATQGVSSKRQTIPLTPVPLAGCYDIGHTHTSFTDAFTRGFDREPVNPLACTPPANPQFKYVDNSTGTVQPYFDMAAQYGFANRMFQTNQGPSFPAHQFLFGGTSAPTTDTPLFASENVGPGKAAGCIAGPKQRVKLINGAGSETADQPIYPCFEHPTLSDLLDAAAPTLDWRYYATMPGSIWTAPDAIRHICEPQTVGEKLQCTGAGWTAHVVPTHPAQVLSDIQACALPAVSWVTPGARYSDHAGLNAGTGPQWVASIVNAVGSQRCAGDRYWDDTVVFVTWDDWGGWYDHVRPFQTTPASAWGAGYTYGFRVPLLVVSAYTPAGVVSNAVLDFGSILYFVEQNFGLGFIGPGTGTYTNYADYQAAGPARGKLADFFTLPAARPFTAIKTSMSAKDFIDEPSSTIGPDDD